MTYCELKDDTTKWAKIIMKQAKLPRTNHIQEIEAAGYDIRSEAKKLEDFYLMSVKR